MKLINSRDLLHKLLLLNLLVDHEYVLVSLLCDRECHVPHAHTYMLCQMQCSMSPKMLSIDVKT